MSDKLLDAYTDMALVDLRRRRITHPFPDNTTERVVERVLSAAGVDPDGTAALELMSIYQRHSCDETTAPSVAALVAGLDRVQADLQALLKAPLAEVSGLDGFASALPAMHVITDGYTDVIAALHAIGRLRERAARVASEIPVRRDGTRTDRPLRALVQAALRDGPPWAPKTIAALLCWWRIDDWRSGNLSTLAERVRAAINRFRSH